MDAITLYNTLSRSKEPFKPINEGFVGIYVCGPTVYGDAHLGHAKSYTTFDVVVRYFRYMGYRVRYVQNITDVGHLTDDGDQGEDKLAKQSKLERLEPMEVAEKYTNRYFEDMDKLGLLRPDITPRASGHIPEQIDMIEKLIEQNHAYVANGNVYFDVTSDPGYGQLSGRTLEAAESGTRISAASDKRHPSDFALWKKADDSHIMKWNSPWGIGYPGWHIECSAMSTKYLGNSFDIHGGGLENQFPHHECEIAQSTCAHGNTHEHPFVRYWMHNNMVTLNGQKMGKSLGNAISLRQFYDGSHKLLSRSWEPVVIRYFLLQSHYRSTTDFSEPALLAAEKGYQNLIAIIHQLSVVSSKEKDGEEWPFQDFKKEVLSAMNDDFNTAQAIAILTTHLKKIRSQLAINSAPANLDEIMSFVEVFMKDVLGIWQASDASAKGSKSSQGDELITDLMELIIQLRKNARTEKNWAMSDQIRDRLREKGIQIMDTPEGTKWEFSN
ncbi:MAG: cysteine--tRNA ligase [Balneolales bacterium]|nr:cysteine--tRNA ligase [Balneolales bacterium]